MRSGKGVLQWYVKTQVAKISAIFEGMYELSDEEAKKKKLGNGTTLYYFKEMGEHPASEYLLKLEKPVMIVQGEKDFQATLEKDFAAYKELLEHKKNVTFKVYENLNHLFVNSVYGNIMKAMKEYKVEQHIGKSVIKDLADWIFNAVS
jgi:esterase/lipase